MGIEAWTVPGSDIVPVEPPFTAPTSWSLSAIGTYEKCQLKAKFKYAQKIPEARSSSAGRGVDFHKSVEDFLRGTETTLPEELGGYHSWFEGLRKYEIYPEHTITLNSQWQLGGERWYKGVLDLKVVIRNGNDNVSQGEGGRSGTEMANPSEIIIYDWKTGKIYPDHDDQKSLYSLAVFGEHPSVLVVRAIHVYFDLGQIREKTFHKDQMHELRAKWDIRAREYLKAFETPETMIPNPGYHCRWCGYSAINGGPCRF